MATAMSKRAKRIYRIVTETATTATPLFSATEAVILPSVIDAAPGQSYIRCDCGKRWHWNDPLVLRVLDAQGEIIFEGCRPCFYARLQRAAEVADWRARYENLRALVRELLTPGGWDEMSGLLERLRAELAIPGMGGVYVHA
jgi:hypothetical protein